MNFERNFEYKLLSNYMQLIFNLKRIGLNSNKIQSYTTSHTQEPYMDH